eukprot:scaffold8288_cov129-Cylindrotheca_fusiformis.AAC.4
MKSKKIPETSKDLPDRILTDIEIAEAMRAAKSRGLPNGWTVDWDNKRQKKVWISPDKSRICYSLPQALAFSVKLGLVSKDKLSDTIGDRKLSVWEVEAKVQEARKRGLPEGWTIVWDNMANQRVWVSPDGSKKCKGLPQALAASVKMGLVVPAEKLPPSSHTTKRVLTEAEIAEAMKEAKHQGLPKGWKVEWNPSKKKRRWIAPDGTRKCNSIPEALRISVQKGLLPSMPRPRTKKRKHVPSGNRKLTEDEIKASMEEAEARGLSDGWSVEWSNDLNRRLWISPRGTKYPSIAEALAMTQSTRARKKGRWENDDRSSYSSEEMDVSYSVCV